MAATAAARPPAARTQADGPRVYVIQDPLHDYATRFIELLRRRFDLRAICVYTDRRERLRHAAAAPILRSDSIAAEYDATPGQFAALADHLRRHHRVVAVVPFSEPTVLGATELARRLGLAWAQPEVMRRFRDKFALKEHLRQRHPQIRINASQRVETVAEILALRRLPAYRRFILKPNDGYGNRDIGLFDEAAPAAAVDAYRQRTRQAPLVMEEYVEGTEYFANGQIDAGGNVTVVAVFEYVRAAANGRHNVDVETRRVAHADPRFARIARYTGQVMRGSGLLRSPFHLELKIDAAGPCLIEGGARLAGHGNAVLCGALHGPGLDLFDLAAHYYLEASDYGPLPLDWNAYDAQAVRYVHGIATRHERIRALDGVAQVEALPEFHQWVRRPAVGARLRPTVDSLSMPWSVVLNAPTEAAAQDAAARVRALIGWNRTGGVAARARAAARHGAQRAAGALRNRLLALLGPGGHRVAPVREFSYAGALAERAGQAAARAADALVRRVQLSTRWPRHAAPPPDPADPARQEQAAAVVRWAREYLARPHPRMGRKGPICPFVQRTIDLGCFQTRIRDDVDGASLVRLRRIVLDEVAAFERRCPITDPRAEFTSLLLVFPQLADARLHLLDRVHDEFKTHLMRRDLMFSPFHPRSTKPSIVNPDFEVFQAPFPAFAVRYMDVRDIAFLGTNRRAFLHYRARFAPLFAQGKVSDDFGYVRMFERACTRFGVPITRAAAPD